MVFGLKLGLPKKVPAEPPPRSATPPSKGGGGAAAVASSGGPAGKSVLTVNEFVSRTKRCREKGLEPTKPELIAYARYLGIDPTTDIDLMWIADEALNAPLPSEWTEHHDSADRVFYYNVQTHASSWTHPLEQLHRDTYKSIVSFRSGDLSKEEQTAQVEKLRRKCEEAEREAHKELQAWTEHTDDQGQKFYYNRDQQRSVWTDPRPARCHTLYLQMKALKALGKHCGIAGRSGSPAPLGDLGRHALSDRERFTKGLLAQQPLFGSGDEGMGGDGVEKKRKKKRKDYEASDRHHHHDHRELLEPGDDSGDDRHGHRKGGGPLDVRKPSLSAVSEVRDSLGLSPSSNLPPMGMMGRQHVLDSMRLPTPPGDGLNSVGRAKVRAGIRLEPIRGGA